MKEILIQRLEQGLSDGVAPNIACSVISGPDVIFEHYCNTRPEDLFDLASLTKVVFTTTFCALQVQQGNISLEQSIEDIVDTKGLDIGQSTIEDLLRHQAALPAWYDFKDIEPAQVLHAIFSFPPERKVRESTLYSDVGFLILGAVLEKKFGVSLGQMYQQMPPEISHNIHIWTDINQANALPTGTTKYRNNICGAVNDDNCYFLGGLQPHAGLFSTLQGLTPFVVMWMESNQLLSGQTQTIFTSRRKALDGTQRAMGWDTPAQDSSAGKDAPQHLFGHLGFTGTSIWIDPRKQLGVVLLTNRTANETSKKDIHSFRQEVHDIIWSSIL